jgi:hypothetical protein
MTSHIPDGGGAVSLLARWRRWRAYRREFSHWCWDRGVFRTGAAYAEWIAEKRSGQVGGAESLPRSYERSKGMSETDCICKPSDRSGIKRREPVRPIRDPNCPVHGRPNYLANLGWIRSPKR